jgi:hypothetical protein
MVAEPTIPYVMPAMVPLLVSVPNEEPVARKAVAVLKFERTIPGAIVQLPEDQPTSVVFELIVPLIPQSAFATIGTTPVSTPASAAAIACCLGGTFLRFMGTPMEMSRKPLCKNLGNLQNIIRENRDISACDVLRHAQSCYFLEIIHS